MLAIVIVFLVAMIIGFAAHRGSVCTVRAVGEMMSAGTGYMFFSILKSIFWVTAVTIPVFLFDPAAAGGVKGWPLTLPAVAGGLLFGMGAAQNGACAYSTMARLVDPEGRMIVTVNGYIYCIGLFVLALAGNWTGRPTPAPAMLELLAGWASVGAVVIVIPAIVELVRLWRSRPADMPVGRLVLSSRYRLSTTAMLMGLASALVFLLIGTSGYSSTFELVIEALFGTRTWPSTARWLVLVAVLAGMLISTIQRGTFRLDLTPEPVWLRSFFGGAIMGIGVALTPGGNDSLVLYGIPTLSPHALPAYLAMAAGIALALGLLRLLFGVETRVECRSDLYVGDTGLGSRPLKPVE
jgi:uncharacterized membrane protein YedE/YeeE